MSDDLERFAAAQDQGGTFDRALQELRRGRKTSHWMWFVFPQIAGLGSSPMARRYAIASLAEARAYLAHPVLGPRLREATTAVLLHIDQPPESILGGIDALKLRSSMTLFAQAAGPGDGELFDRVLAVFYGGEPDRATMVRLGGR